ncbi:hypothetical protein HID58_091753 [Brassica napus]|uniref:ATPase AAA-type core domain-containing protein n=1 Tax=Brassica napus TaxID=3708 RepID=A0ABQ7WYS5_BRANA|nr:hypothetical protein HID58_091753 [Brassica napus]
MKYNTDKLDIHSVNLHVVGELTLANISYQGIELNWRIFVNKNTKTWERRLESTAQEKTIRVVHTYSHSFDTWETKSLENHSTFETIAMSTILIGSSKGKISTIELGDLGREITCCMGSTVLALSDLLRSLVLGTPWGEARIIVIFTTNNLDMLDPTLLSRISVDIYMGHCCFEGFKVLASNYWASLMTMMMSYTVSIQTSSVLLMDKLSHQYKSELMKSEDVNVVIEDLVRTLESFNSR